MINLTDTKDILLGSLTPEQSKVIARIQHTLLPNLECQFNSPQGLAKVANTSIENGHQIFKYLLDNDVIYYKEDVPGKLFYRYHSLPNHLRSRL